VKRKITTYKTVTLDRACKAVKVYNKGLYGCVKNPDLDKRAHDMFAGGLGSTLGKLERQVVFIGDDYGGIAGRPAALKLAPDIARDIFRIRESYEQAAGSALPIVSNAADRGTIEILYRPFVKPLVDKNGPETSNWLVWAAKFWHHLNPLAFPIEDSRVDDFFVLTGDFASVDKYMKFSDRFRSFALSHEDWLPQLRQADGGVDGEVDGMPVCSDNKLWDKMIYGLGDLDRAGE
jgi:hypothetical protein